MRPPALRDVSWNNVKDAVKKRGAHDTPTPPNEAASTSSSTTDTVTTARSTDPTPIHPNAAPGQASRSHSSGQSTPLALLRVQILQARNLQAKDRGGQSDPFVILSLPGTAPSPSSKRDYRRQTAVIPKTTSPKWNADETTYDLDVVPEWMGPVSEQRGSTPARPDNKRKISGAAVKILGAPVRLGARGAVAGARAVNARRRRTPRPMRLTEVKPVAGTAQINTHHHAHSCVATLEFVLWDKDKWSANDYLGEVSLPVARWIQNESSVRWEDQEPIWLPLVSSRRNTVVTGELQVRVGFLPSPSAPQEPLEAVYGQLVAASSAGVAGAPVRSVPADQSVGTAGPDEAFLDDGLSSGDESEDMEEILTDDDDDMSTDGEGGATTTEGESDGAFNDQHYQSVVGGGGATRPLDSATTSAEGAAAAPEAAPVHGGRFRRRLARSSRGASGEDDTGSDAGGKQRKKRVKERRVRRNKKRDDEGYAFKADGSDIIGIVQIEIKSASDLPRWKNSLNLRFDMDPMCIVSFSDKVFRTRVQRHSLNPVWDEKLLFRVRRHEASYVTKLAIYDWDKLSSHDFVGAADLRIAELIAQAPKPDEQTGLYAASEDGSRPMRKFDLRLTRSGDEEAKFEKHSPQLHVEAKFTPYAALRQRFWRQLLTQYDTNDSGSLSTLELTSMLDSLGSTLSTTTIEDFFRRFDKKPDEDELTLEEAIRALEAEITKPWDEKRTAHDGSDTAPPSGAVTPALEGGMDFSGPNAASESEAELAKRANLVPISGLDSASPANEPTLKRVEPGVGKTLSAPGLVARDMSSLSLAPSTTTTSSTNSGTSNSEKPKERVILLKSCPLCHMPRLSKKAEVDIVTHLAVCASQDWRRVDSLVVGNFVTASQAHKKWYTKVLTKISQGEYRVGADSANIIVQDRATGELMEEKMQVYVRLGIRLLYRGAKSRMESQRIKRMLYNMSVKQGVKFDNPLSARDIKNFVAFHNLNMAEVADPIESFKTFNEFFYRKLKPGARPIEEPDNPLRIVSGADCRMMAFESVSDSKKLWIKGRNFSIKQLLGEGCEEPSMDPYTDGPVCIMRLAPQDYHRYHSPCDATVGAITHIAGEYYTVNPQAIRSPIDVYIDNVRTVVPLHTAQGTFYYVCIGAMMVGAIELTIKEGQTLKRGDEIGYFAFGGSTILFIAPKGTLTFDEDILEASSRACEMLVAVGNGIGRATAAA